MQLWQKKRNQFFIDEMTSKDIPQAVAVDNLTYPTPVGKQYFEECLRRSAYGTCRPWVAYCAEQLIGYMVWCLRGEWGELLELQRLAIHPNWQNKGYGKKLYQFFLAELETQRYTKAELLVPEEKLEEMLYGEEKRKVLEWVKRQEFANAQPPVRLSDRNICFCRLIS